jgi:hypothetical protein
MLCPIQAQHHDGRHSVRRPCIKPNRQNNSFFRRPYIEIRELKPNHVKIILTRGGGSPKVFAGIVWAIQVYNRNRKFFSKHGSKCRMETTQICNGVDINTKISLSWKPDSLPTECNFSSSVFGNDEYVQRLPRSYIGPLVGMGLPAPTILRGSTNELMFVFTFNESDKLYLITGPTAQYETIPIPFDELGQHQFLLRFYSSEYEDTQGKLVRLEATSWDNVKLIQVKL